MKKIMLFAAACVALAACTKNVDTRSTANGTPFEKGQKVTLTVTNPQTRATSELNNTTDAIDFKWEDGDQILVTVGGNSATFTVSKITGGGASAEFEGTMPGSGTNFDVQFPATTPDLTSQNYVEGEALPHDSMLAKAFGCTLDSPFSLSAQNATLRLDLYGTGIKVTKIVVKQEGGSNTYTLDCGTGAAVGATSDAAKPFFVVVSPGTYKFTAEVYDDSETPQLIASFTPSEEQTFSVGSSLTMPEKEVIDPSEYLCFTCTSGNVAIGMTKKNTKTTNAPDIALQYYTDKTGWQDFKLGDGNKGVSDSTLIALASGEKVCFKAKTTNDSLALNIMAYNYFTTTTTDNGKVNVSGNIMSLLDGDNPGTTLTHTYTFTSIFMGCTSIQNASGLSLPATSLVKHCYAHMFNGCTALESAPVLTATTLANSCYNNMFRGCTALKTAPALTATTLAENCYSYMFKDCKALNTAPTLSATTLAPNCYTWMFNGCTALESAPALPATTMAPNCYNSMFSGCTALTIAPTLPATTMVERCYISMFWNCTALETATLPATTLAEYCYSQIFKGCSKLSSVTMLATDVSAKYCLIDWLTDAGTAASVKNLFVAPSMVDNETITGAKGNFTIYPYYSEAPGLTATKIGTTWWAPVNCGYDASNPNGKFYQWAKKQGFAWSVKLTSSDIINTQLASMSAGVGNTKYIYEKNKCCWYTGCTTSDTWPTDKSYDPCPTGWKVPTATELTALKEGGSVWDSTDKGRYFPNKTAADKIFLPALGAFDGYDLSVFCSGEFGYYWSSSPETSDSEMGTSLNFDNSMATAPSGACRYLGLAVRCVKE